MSYNLIYNSFSISLENERDGKATPTNEDIKKDNGASL